MMIFQGFRLLKPWLLIVSLLLNSFICQVASAVDEKPYVIAVNQQYAGEQSKQLIEQLFNTMYAPLGIIPEYQYLPSRRGLHLANQSKLDAESGRIAAVANQYDNLISVPAPLIQHEAYIFCTEASLCTHESKRVYGVVQGFHAAVNHCQNKGLSCLFENSYPLMGQMLNDQLLDAVIGNKQQVMRAFCDTNTTYFYRRHDSLVVTSYHLENQAHRDKVAALATSIEAMHQRGDFDAFLTFNHQAPTACKAMFSKI